MKIAIAQLNPTIGDLAHNAQQIVDAAQDAHTQGAQVLVTTELALCGYPPRDLLLRPGFIAAMAQQLESLAAEMPSELAVLVGYAAANSNALQRGEKPLFNSTALLQSGQVQQVFHKQLLPTYDVFDEDRYFAPGTGPSRFTLHTPEGDVNLGVTICEDLWNDEEFWGGRSYPRNPIADLAEAGVDLVLNARGAEALEATAQALRDRFGVTVVTVAADVTTEAGRAQVLAAAEGVDILVTNAGGPPPGMWSDWTRDDFIRALDANMLTPIALMKALLPGMIAKGWGRVVNITSQSVKAPIPQLGLSNSARAGLTGYVAGTSRQVAPHGVTINNLLPGIHDTDRAVALDGGVVKAEGITMEEARAKRAAAIPARRYGTAAEFGAACAFLCSQQAGFIVGQNILLDGGATNSTL